ncbi:MAG: hydantoinase/oxoprolinase family protein [Syntrophaceae bacterium]|nr:hydantoinase/oxoprolinase family protein [Syntrophaceae bacterium]
MSRDLLAIAMDAGGTMTDTFVVDAEGNFVIGKATTTPWDESEGFVESSQDALGQWDVDENKAFTQFEVAVYSGTTMINTLITRTGKNIGLVVNKGFEDILLIEQGRQVWSGYSHPDRVHAVTHVHNEPLVPRKRVVGVSERTDMFGKVVIPLYENDARKAVEYLLNEEVEAIAICFLHSYANPVSEERMESICKEVMGAHDVSIPVYRSSKVQPVIRENQRVNATVIEAYAADPVRAQLHKIENSATKRGFRRQMTTMLSYGGLANIRHPRLHETLVSGPIGGIMGAQYLAKILNKNNVLAVDMGGTSYDYGIINRGRLQLTNEPEIARFKLNLPSIELNSVRGGAGLYVTVDPVTNRIVMGPEGARSYPGPVCFGHGNETPTITDCLAVNGYLNKDYFLGGKVILDLDAAHQALKRCVAEPLGLPVQEIADGIIQLWLHDAKEVTKRAIHLRGGNVADYTLMGYGGAGPLVLAGISEGLAFNSVVTVPFAAAFSAFGCTVPDYSHRYTKSCLLAIPYRADQSSKGGVGGALKVFWDELQKEANTSFEEEGMDLQDIEYKRIAYIRYSGQLDDVEVAADGKWSGSSQDVDDIITSFENLYSEIFVKAAKYPQAGYTILQVALVASIKTKKPEFPRLPLSGPSPSAQAAKGTRKVYMDGDWNTANLFEMDLLEPGNVIEGLAIIEHPATTLVVPANRRARIDDRKFVWLENR